MSNTIVFDNRYETNVATAALVEDCQMLQRALRMLSYGNIEEAKEEIQCVLECLSDNIQNKTEVPEGGFQPSESSFICLSYDNGFVLIDGEEPRCAGGIAFSEIRYGNPSCNPEKCQYSACCDGCCNPVDGEILHSSGNLYDGVGAHTEKFLF